jgi:hypothetical protein
MAEYAGNLWNMSAARQVGTAKDPVGNRTKRVFLESGALNKGLPDALGVGLPGDVLTRSRISAAGAQLREPATGHRRFSCRGTRATPARS